MRPTHSPMTWETIRPLCLSWMWVRFFQVYLPANIIFQLAVKVFAKAYGWESKSKFLMVHMWIIFEEDEEEWRIINIGRIGITSWVPTLFLHLTMGVKHLLNWFWKKTCDHLIPEISMSIKEPIPLVAVIPDARYKFCAICEWKIGRRWNPWW